MDQDYFELWKQKCIEASHFKHEAQVIRSEIDHMRARLRSYCDEHHGLREILFPEKNWTDEGERQRGFDFDTPGL